MARQSSQTVSSAVDGREIRARTARPMVALGVLPLRIAGPLAVLLLWLVASASSPFVASVIPPPGAVIAALVDRAHDGTLLLDVGASLGRALLGILAASAIAVPIGIAMGTLPLMRRLLTPPVELVRPVSAVAWIPLAILWFGIGLKSVVFVIFIGCVFIVLLNTLAGVRAIDPFLVKAARTLGAGRATIFLKVVLPAALPGILLGIRVALAGAWGGVIVAEMIASQEGVGYMIHWAQTTFRPELVIGGMLLIGAVGFGLNRLFVALECRLLVGRLP